MNYEIKILKGKPDTGKLGKKMQQVKAQLESLDVEKAAAAILPDIPPPELVQGVAVHFNLDEIDNLAFAVSLEPENLEGTTRDTRARSLVQTMKRHNRLGELVEVLERERPMVDWPDVG